MCAHAWDMHVCAHAWDTVYCCCRAGEIVPATAEATTVREEEVGGVREKLRYALVSLSRSDAFLDLLLQELQAAGIMQL